MLSKNVCQVKKSVKERGEGKAFGNCNRGEGKKDNVRRRSPGPHLVHAIPFHPRNVEPHG